MASPITDQIACVCREIALRERVYPRFVASGRVKQAAADRELALMRDVLETLRSVERREAETRAFFGEDAADG